MSFAGSCHGRSRPVRHNKVHAGGGAGAAAGLRRHWWRVRSGAAGDRLLPQGPAHCLCRSHCSLQVHISSLLRTSCMHCSVGWPQSWLQYLSLTILRSHYMEFLGWHVCLQKSVCHACCRITALQCHIQLLLYSAGHNLWSGCRTIQRWSARRAKR